jgi:hypothetical protein
MKKIYLLLLLATFSLNLFCQQDSLIVHDSMYLFLWDTIANDWVGRLRWVYAYDANGNITEYIYYKWNVYNWLGLGHEVHT